ncbi:MAG: hypothetical protein KDC80_05630 [Saprospiraceae bacterium]|nr:hypothetical protein [Saprospiraceae bacterium]
MRKRATSLIILIFALQIACSTAKSKLTQDGQIYNTDFQFEQDQVLVLLVELRPNEASLRRARIVEGNFKPNVEPLLQREAVRVQYLDERDQVLLEKILDHPLYQYKEYSNEEGQLQYIRIEGEKGSLLLRTQYSKAIKAIRIDYGEDNTYRLVTQIPLALTED